jgi:hypothetical protein
MNTIDLSKCEFKTVILEYGILYGSFLIHGLCNFMFCYCSHDCWVVDVVATCKGRIARTMTKKCEMKLILQACYNLYSGETKFLSRFFLNLMIWCCVSLFFKIDGLLVANQFSLFVWIWYCFSTMWLLWKIFTIFLHIMVGQNPKKSNAQETIVFISLMWF